MHQTPQPLRFRDFLSGALAFALAIILGFLGERYGNALVAIMLFIVGDLLGASYDYYFARLRRNGPHPPHGTF